LIGKLVRNYSIKVRFAYQVERWVLRETAQLKQPFD